MYTCIGAHINVVDLYSSTSRSFPFQTDVSIILPSLNKQLYNGTRNNRITESNLQCNTTRFVCK